MEGFRTNSGEIPAVLVGETYGLNPYYVFQMIENSLTRSTSLFVKCSSFLMILLMLEAAHGFNFNSVIQRTTAGPNVYLGPTAVEGKFGLALGRVCALWLCVSSIEASVTFGDRN